MGRLGVPVVRGAARGAERRSHWLSLTDSGPQDRPTDIRCNRMVFCWGRTDDRYNPAHICGGPADVSWGGEVSVGGHDPGTVC